MIYITTHKKVDLHPLDGYKLLQVGAALHPSIGYLADNSGSSISEKNRNYSELTGLYWIWKNRSNENLLGLVHYRRFFFKPFSKNIIQYNEIKSLMKNYDIILPQKTVMFKKTVKENYRDKHHLRDLMLCGEIIKDKYPEFYESFLRVLGSHSYYAFNMFVMNNELLNEYATWLFSILFELDARIDITKYDDYNQRVFGFLSERLFNVWLLKNSSLRIKELPVYNTEKSLLKQKIFKKIDKVKLLVE